MGPRRNNPNKYQRNDWSQPLENFDTFQDEVWEMALQRYGVDEDGDSPVNIIFIDRTKYEAMHYRPVPYDHEAKTEEELDAIFTVLDINLSNALTEMRSFIQFRNHHNRQARKQD